MYTHEYNKYYASCSLCPRQCHVNRLQRQRGRCHVTSDLLVARAAAHMWEEPCLTGTNGSGTVFFSGCSLGCVYCQNRAISGGAAGKVITRERLTEIFLKLQEQGLHNINLVTPDHYAPTVTAALRAAKQKGLMLPVVVNTGGYMTVETVRLLAPQVDIWLPDFKYFDPRIAERYSHAKDYFRVADAAIREMYRRCGEPVFDEQGLLKKGMIIRHLLLPGQIEDSKRILRHLYRQYGNRVYYSLMSQFTPGEEVLGPYPELNRKVSKEEYDELVDYALDLGIENGFIQDGEAASESFIPSFKLQGV